MTNKGLAETFFWGLASVILLKYFLTVVVVAFPSANPAAVMMMAVAIGVLDMSAWLLLVVLLYSLASMLRVFGDTAK